MGGRDRRCLGICALPALLRPQRVKLSIPSRELEDLKTYGAGMRANVLRN